MAAPGANPRKFAEKIAQHMQKGAEEEAEFRKIMSECAMVKQNPHRVSTLIIVLTPKMYPHHTEPFVGGLKRDTCHFLM